MDKLTEILNILPLNLKEIILKVPPSILRELQEIRLRLFRPLVLVTGEGYIYLNAKGEMLKAYEGAYFLTEEDMGRALQLVSNSSLYALEEELKNGFITINGGHRVGLSGKVVLKDGRVKNLKYISGMNIRFAKEVLGFADEVLPHIWQEGEKIKHTMIFSPPGCGKTTLLRDIIRQISNNNIAVGLVDERSEIAGSHRGFPTMDVGVNTDILDSCPKAEGMIMLLRSMSPQVIATDELGKIEDVRALEEVLNAGVKVIFTVHGSCLEEIAKRPALNYLLGLNLIEAYVQLGKFPKVGSVVKIS